MNSEQKQLSIKSIGKIISAFFIGSFAGLTIIGVSFFAIIVIGDNIVNHSLKIGGNNWWLTVLSFTKDESGFSAGLGGGAILFIIGVGIINSVMAHHIQKRKNNKSTDQSRMI